jgi:2-polyprenyl-3-methyl-5-hydroxy-6-metoxy-1,4-benzoquinol methylase
LSANCIVCGGTYQPSRIPGLVECCACGFISTDLDLSDDAIRALYSEKYFHGEEYADYLSEKDSLRWSFQQRLKTITGLVPQTASKHLFEVGCAYGFFLELAKSHFASVQGMDISEAAVAYARDVLRVDAAAGDLLTAPVNGPFDVVCMWDVIEHLRQPDQVIARLASMMSDCGTLAITTGDVGSFNARLRGKSWRLIHPPTHLHYFSSRTLTAFLQRHGFRVVQLTHPGTYRTFRNIFYTILVLHGDSKRAYEWIRRFPLLDRAIYLNLFNLMFVVAQKNSSR